jgi:8-oxo-dGTP pyrophosphatase MutT (NUDIX family)
MSEWVDLYDRSHQATGRVMERTQEVDGQHCVLVVSFWVRSADGRLLLEQRSPEKEWFPGYWECGGGGALAGESPYDAVQREVTEELGLHIPEGNWRLLGEMDNEEVLEGRYFHHWNCSYLVETTQPEPELALQREEVAATRWFTIQELDALLADPEAPVTKYTRRLYAAYRPVLAAPMAAPGQKPKKRLPPKEAEAQ